MVFIHKNNKFPKFLLWNNPLSCQIEEDTAKNKKYTNRGFSSETIWKYLNENLEKIVQGVPRTSEEKKDHVKI